MQKIITKNKRKLKEIAGLFGCSISAVYYALRFQSNTIQASRIRCYVMNHVESSVFLTQK